MYEYLLERLINKPKIHANLRRTAKEGLISKIDRIQLSELALKYFGVDENGEYTNDKEQIVAYRCPYSGKITKDPNDLDLDHIIPVSNGGGTVLFNCIPIDSMINKSKNASSLLKWWTMQDYFGVDELKRLLDYMFEAYSLTFKKYTVEELEASYKDYFEELSEEYTFDSTEALTEENDTYRRREEEKKKETMTFEKMSYQKFIINLIGFLKKNGIDCSIYESKLKELEDKNIFKDIEKCELIQRTLQNYIINELGDDNRYISYSISIDVNRLLNSFKTNDIVSELKERLRFIQRLLKDNNKTLKQYFENVPDIEEYNIIYMDNPGDVNITEFLNSLTLNHETKIDKFIEMLSMDEYTSYKDGKPDDNNIFKGSNKIPFKGYEHIEGFNTSQFWTSNNDIIVERINAKIKLLSKKEILTKEETQELEKLNKANKAIDDYNFANHFNNDIKIDKFIEMASMDEYTGYKDGKPNDKNIFSEMNPVPFKDYEHIYGLNTSCFWGSNANRIMQKIQAKLDLLSSKEKLTQDEEKKLEKLKKANKAIDDYNFANSMNLDIKIDKFIEMLSMDEYTGYKDGIPDDNSILKTGNKVPFKDYEHIDGLNTSYFWNANADKIVKRIQAKHNILSNKETLTIEEEQELEKLNKANKAVEDYNFANRLSNDMKIDKFIEMASMDEYTGYKDGQPDNNNIFKVNNEIPFKGYEHIEGLNTRQFWSGNYKKIIQRIKAKIELLSQKEILTDEETMKLEMLNKANKAIGDFYFNNNFNVDLRINKFIEMLSMDEYTSYKDGKPDDNNIFKGSNKIPFKGYEHIAGLNTSHFWITNGDKIVERIKEKIELLSNKETLTQEDQQKLENLNKANKAIEDYNFYNNKNSNNINNEINKYIKIDKFIEMLSMDKYTGYKDGKPDDNNIFKGDNQVPFKDYEHIEGLNTSYFWTTNGDIILERIKGKIELLINKEKLTQEETQELEKLNKANKAIDDYNFANHYNNDIKIDKFIEMLSMDKYTSYKDGKPDDNNIFKGSNKIPFKGYEHIDGLNTSHFWITNGDKIVERIKEKIELLSNKETLTQEDQQKLENLNKANKAIDDCNFANTNNPNLKIDKFIEMLSMDEYTSYQNGKPDNKNIFKASNRVPFRDYEHIDGLNTLYFWSNNANRIVERIKEKIELLSNKETLTQENQQKLENLNKANKAIDGYNFFNPVNLYLKIDKFIEMLSMDEYTGYKDGKPDDKNIFKGSNKVSYKDYDFIEGLNTSHFWVFNDEKIIQRIKEELELLSQKETLTQEEQQKLEKLTKSTKAIDDYNFANTNNLDLKIDKFIEMLSMDEYTSYQNGKPDEYNIFSQYNKVSFKDYEHIDGLNTANFWTANSTKYIIPMLFFSDDYSDSNYNKARNNVMTYLNYLRKRKKQAEFNTINEYIETLDGKKKEVQALIKLRDELLFKEKEVVLLKNELRNNEISNRRAV